MIEIWNSRDIPLADILNRREAEQPDVSGVVGEILADVRQNGDAAVLAYTERFDGVRLTDMRVPEEEMRAAKTEVGADYLRILADAAENIRAYHQRQLRQGFVSA